MNTIDRMLDRISLGLSDPRYYATTLHRSAKDRYLDQLITDHRKRSRKAGDELERLLDKLQSTSK